MSDFYPRDIRGVKSLEEIYSIALKARKKIEKLTEEKEALQSELDLLKSEFNLKKIEIDSIKSDVIKAKSDIEGLKPKNPVGGGN